MGEQLEACGFRERLAARACNLGRCGNLSDRSKARSILYTRRVSNAGKKRGMRSTSLPCQVQAGVPCSDQPSLQEQGVGLAVATRRKQAGSLVLAFLGPSTLTAQPLLLHLQLAKKVSLEAAQGASIWGTHAGVSCCWRRPHEATATGARLWQQPTGLPWTRLRRGFSARHLRTFRTHLCSMKKTTQAHLGQCGHSARAQCMRSGGVWTFRGSRGLTMRRACRSAASRGEMPVRQVQR